MRATWLTLFLLACDDGTYVRVFIEPSAQSSSHIARLDLDATLAGQIAVTVLSANDGIDLPTDAVLRVRSGQGLLELTAIARDGLGNEIDRGFGSTEVRRRETSEAHITLGAAQLTIDKTTYDFGSVVGGTPSGAATFVVRNGGGNASAALNVSIDGADAAVFSKSSDGCTDSVLPAGATCTFDVRLDAPETTMTIARSTRLTVAETHSTVSVNLLGSVLARGVLTLAPVAHDFGSLGVDETGTFALTVANQGEETSGPLAISISGSGAAAFSATGCDQRLAPKTSCTLQVSAHSSVLGKALAQLLVQADPGGATVTDLTASIDPTLIVDVLKVSGGSGSVTSSPSGLDCSSAMPVCKQVFPAGPVTLTAHVDKSLFLGWEGDCSGTDLTCVVPLTQAHATVTAKFLGHNYVFASSATATYAAIGPADTFCQQLSVAAKLPGTYRAFLWQPPLGAMTAPAHILDGTNARGWILPDNQQTPVLDELILPTALLHTIGWTELGEDVSTFANPHYRLAMTVTESDGQKSTDDCNMGLIRIAIPGVSDASWAGAAGGMGQCTDAFRVFCFGVDLSNPLP